MRFTAATQRRSRKAGVSDSWVPALMTGRSIYPHNVSGWQTRSQLTAEGLAGKSPICGELHSGWRERSLQRAPVHQVPLCPLDRQDSSTVVTYAILLHGIARGSEVDLKVAPPHLFLGWLDQARNLPEHFQLQLQLQPQLSKSRLR